MSFPFLSPLLSLAFSFSIHPSRSLSFSLCREDALPALVACWPCEPGSGCGSDRGSGNRRAAASSQSARVSSAVLRSCGVAQGPSPCSGSPAECWPGKPRFLRAGRACRSVAVALPSRSLPPPRAPLARLLTSTVVKRNHHAARTARTVSLRPHSSGRPTAPLVMDWCACGATGRCVDARPGSQREERHGRPRRV